MPTAPESVPTATPSAALSSRSRRRRISSHQIASFNPKVVGSVLTDGGNGVFVQLGSVKTAVGAMREWDKLVEEFPGVLSGRPLKIERVALANRGAFYRIRTGPISGITRARAICAQFAARDRGCLVVRR